jgi:hypothetical protein
MNIQMTSPTWSTGLESQQGSSNEAINSDVVMEFLRLSARYLELDTVAIEGNLIPCKARAH